MVLDPGYTSLPGVYLYPHTAGLFNFKLAWPHIQGPVHGGKLQLLDNHLIRGREILHQSPEGLFNISLQPLMQQFLKDKSITFFNCPPDTTGVHSIRWTTRSASSSTNRDCAALGPQKRLLCHPRRKHSYNILAVGCYFMQSQVSFFHQCFLGPFHGINSIRCRR